MKEGEKEVKERGGDGRRPDKVEDADPVVRGLVGGRDVHAVD